VRLTLLLDMAADGFGDRVLAGRRSGGITAAELARRSHSGAALIRERAADALVYLDVNGPAFPVALFAAARAGVPLVPLNYRLGQRQLDELLARHPKALGIAGPGALTHFERAGLSAMTSDDWLEQTRADRGEITDDGQGDDENPVAVVIYTSGTTSAPKGVLLRHDNLVSYVLGSVEFGSAGETEAALVSVPPYHIAAVANVITNLYAGRRTLVLEAFAPGEWLRTVREEEVSSAMVVPTMLARIIDSEEDRSVPTLRGRPAEAPGGPGRGGVRRPGPGVGPAHRGRRRAPPRDRPRPRRPTRLHPAGPAVEQDPGPLLAPERATPHRDRQAPATPGARHDPAPQDRIRPMCSKVAK